MAITILLHITGEEPIVGEIDELPEPSDNMLVVQNPRKRDGKDLHYIDNQVTTVIWPWTRINFIEVLPSGEQDKIIGFVRE